MHFRGLAGGGQPREGAGALCGRAQLSSRHDFGGDSCGSGAAVLPPAGAAVRHEPVNAPIVLGPHAFDPSAYRALPDWLQRICARAPEYQLVLRGGAILPAALAERLQQRLVVLGLDATA